MNFASQTLSTKPPRLRALLIALLALGLATGLRAEDDHDHDHEHDHADHGAHAHEDGEEEHDDHDHKDGDHEAHDEHEGHDHGHEEGVVELSPAVMGEFGIVTAKAGPGVLHEEVVLPGEIQFNRERVAKVTPRYTGTVQAIDARLADQVTQGQVLAALESTETLRPFDLKAPFDGVVTAYDVTLGETVEAGQPLFTVADLSTVWADLRIYQRDMGKITKGQSVLIAGGHDEATFRGTISYIAPVIDEHTRTGLARVVVDNHDGDWKPGQFIKGSVSIDEHRAPVVVPRTAVLTYEDQTVVFVQTDEGFEPRPIVLGHGDAASFAVQSGLKPGEVYVTRNPISLKAELSKGSFGGHEGHVH